ncbi:peroxisomal membrane anchor protein conserved region-domain-containing protein [Chytridium lagenaria]|nr:peroxisomal membrane anchor protein conserved region-domain-containing protein [Chytridium lagenaria]
MAKREETIELAVRFLKDPKVQASTLAKRIAFLESKGLTAEEIEEAVNRSNADASSKPAAATSPSPAVTASQQPYMGQQPMYGNPYYGQMVPPVQQNPLNWKDYTLGAIGVATVGYGLFELGKRYVAPYFVWPTEAKLAADQKKIEEQLGSATAAVKGHGKIIDKAKDAQNTAMIDLQSEVKSLKNLLLNRRMGPAPPVAAPLPIAAASVLPASSEDDSAKPASSTPAGGLVTSAGTPGLGGVGVSRTLPFGKPIGIPAWQLAASSSGSSSTAASPSLVADKSEGDESAAAAPSS